MNRLFLVILFLILVLSSCKDPDYRIDPDTSGTVTIDNTLFGTGPYYAIGFNFDRALKISSLATPKPDITLGYDEGSAIFFLQTNAGINGFHLTGEYPDQTLAKEAFDNLTTFNVNDWEEWANPLKVNQVWLYRSADEHYAKIRIIALSAEDLDPRDYAECTFEWVYQPDGSLTFPGK
ncbi:MAG: hypothetical protein JXR66_11495 [Bacteroidales bacterium]|nr:hypothetical protein [Bacteroidales bacterium]